MLSILLETNTKVLKTSLTQSTYFENADFPNL